MKTYLNLKRFLSIYPSFWIALFTFGSITIAIPTSAQPNFIGTQNQLQANQNSLLTQGRIAYQAGKYAEATKIWQQAHQHYQTHGNKIDRALTLNYLSLSSQMQGNWQQAEQYISQSLNLLQQEPDLAGNNLNIYAQALNNRSKLELKMGKTETALHTLRQATDIYEQAGDEIGKLGSQINQAQALQSLGLYRRAQVLLQQILIDLEAQSDPTLKIAGLRSLGIALQVTGDLNHAQKILQQSLQISQQLNLPEESSVTLFSLGNIAKATDKPKEAISFYQQAANNTAQPLLKTEIQLNQLGLLIENQQWQQAKNLLPPIEASVNEFAAQPSRRSIYSPVKEFAVQPSRRSIYSQVNLAKHLLDLANANVATTDPKPLLENAIAQAQQLQDTKAESYALGILGSLYEQEQQWSLGSEYSQKALYLSQIINDHHLSYQWQWQLGRLLSKENDYAGAISAYSEAVNALESLRSDLVLTNIDLQYSFRDSVEPVYRELVSLLLQPQKNEPISQANLSQARDTIESLQLAELNDFFREACLDATPTSIDNVDSKAAVIYPIILRDRLEVIVSLPGKPLRNYSTQISQAELEEEIEQLRETIVIRSQREFYKPAQNLYNQLIRPALNELVDSEIETLVFVPDGILRNIPMGVLHDGEDYLIEKYNLALTPGLQLLAPHSLKEVKLKTLAAGLTKERQGFSPLDYVKVELEDIQKQLDSTVLLDQEFTQEAFQAKMESVDYPIVHIATHGQFSSILEDTFLLAWDTRIQINQLNSILQTHDFKQQQAIELLVLSACETAVGDRRAALGLAGMAVRAGARSTLATLWSVNDLTTALAIDNFYQQLTQTTVPTSKTKALRESQLMLINSNQFNHPYYWAPFILIGNWL